jgi:CRISPR-associated protein Csm4
MRADIIRMRFAGGLHIGLRGVGIEETAFQLSADTLFAALITQLAQRAPDLIDPLIESFPRRTGGGFDPGDPPFIISSTFPFAGDIQFFPVPQMHWDNKAAEPILTSNAGGISKKLKKVILVSESLFRRMIEGDPLTALEPARVAFQEGSVWVARDDLSLLPESVLKSGKIWQSESRDRVAVDRNTSRSAVFRHGEVRFAAGCGLWFALSIRDPGFTLGGTSIREAIAFLLSDLSIVGIGGLRSHGLGAFEVDWPGTIDLPDDEQVPDSVVVSLSRVHPGPNDLASLAMRTASYQLTQIGGWMHAEGVPDRQRLNVTMLKEGAVLSQDSQNRIAGCLVDVSPGGAPHPSWRYGLAFPVGLTSGHK